MKIPQRRMRRYVETARCANRGWLLRCEQLLRRSQKRARDPR
ncbi:hypothetical protein V6Z12_D07G214900 [Gossypium hirsutum]